TSSRTGILVRMPSSLKAALVRETARRGSNLNDVAAGMLAERFGVPHRPSGRRRAALAGSSPVALLRIPPQLKEELLAEAARRNSNTNDVIVGVLAEELDIPLDSKRKEPMASSNGSQNGRARSK